jgi:predicted ArsR family transcriptional regulator
MEASMVNRHYSLAEKVVEAFKSNLNETMCRQISDNEFSQLAEMIREAISDELETAVALIEEVARKLREGVEKPDIGM